MLAILGGTGPEGKGLALRLAMAGESVIIGSRSTERGASAAAELGEGAPGASISARTTPEPLPPVMWCSWPFPTRVSVPVLEELAGSLEGKIVVSVIAPMVFERGKGASAVDVEAGSAAQEAQEILPNAQVVAAFQNVSAEELQDPQVDMEGDVVVCSDHADSKKIGDGTGGQDQEPAGYRRRSAGQRQVR